MTSIQRSTAWELLPGDGTQTNQDLARSERKNEDQMDVLDLTLTWLGVVAIKELMFTWISSRHVFSLVQFHSFWFT